MKPTDHLELERRVRALLDDPAHHGHPLAEALHDVWHELNQHVERLERITLLSDSFQAMARDRERGLSQRFERQLRRINRIVRISDHYQNMLRELNSHLEEASYRDMLTGINNRRALMQRLQQEAQRASRHKTTFVVAMIDIDRFKHINDVFGHEMGDQALIEIAQTLSRDLREYDACGRWGGEEFLLILPDTTLTDAHAIVQRKLAAVRRLDLACGKAGQGSLTVSAGLAEHHVGEALTHTLSRADAALYTAKHRGRDCVAPTLQEITDA